MRMSLTDNVFVKFLGSALKVQTIFSGGMATGVSSAFVYLNAGLKDNAFICMFFTIVWMSLFAFNLYLEKHGFKSGFENGPETRVVVQPEAVAAVELALNE